MTHTPTTGQVRKSYVEGVEHDCYYEGDVTTTPDGVYVGEVFDRWHAEEIRKAKEEAWEEGANTLQDIYGDPLDSNPYRKEQND